MSIRSAHRGSLSFQVLGPIEVHDADGRPVDIKGPRHRGVLARLILAHGRMVPLQVLIDDLWEEDPPRDPTSAVRTFVAALRAALEPGRPPRTPPRLIVTRGPGYAADIPPDAVDARAFETTLQHIDDASPSAVEDLQQALARWRGPAYADFADARWARAERARLGELRLTTIERLGRARLRAGRAADAVADLDAHVTDHPWREEGWRLLALALYRCDRSGDALAVLRRARTQLADELGIDPGPALATVETGILRRSPHLDLHPDLDPDPDGHSRPRAVEQVWARTAAEWEDGDVLGRRAKLESTTSLLAGLAMHGGRPVTSAARHATTVAAAEELGDPDLTARVIAGYEVPSVWTRSDDPASSAALVASAERTLRLLEGTGARPATRARLLTTIARETRGLPDPRGPRAARDAEALARATGDPALLVSALSGRLLQSFHRAGAAGERAGLGAEILALATEHDLPTYMIFGRLTLMQSAAALGDLDGAAAHARALGVLGHRFDRPLVEVFVSWFEAMRAAGAGEPDTEDRYRRAARRLAGAGMPGVEHGLLDLALVCTRLRRGRPPGPVDDPGPHLPWIRPHLLLADGRRDEAATAVRALPDPPPGHLFEALWCLAGDAAMATGDDDVAARAEAALAPAAAEIAGAGSAMITLGPVEEYLQALRRR
jgi:DNA-binding SARP family transcriptional activator